MNSEPTRGFLRNSRYLKAQPEVSPGFSDYSMFNSGGVEGEVGEFLYGFVRLTKPDCILETGTHRGISTLYMAAALKENAKGHIWTLEIFDENIKASRALWRDTGVDSFATCLKQDSLSYRPEGMFDILFLDSEPQYRFDEFVNFYPHLKPGGFIFIHDLHPNLGLSDVVVNGMRNWPYGDFREKFGEHILDHSLQTFSFFTPRGFTVFQKTAPDFNQTLFLRGEKVING